MIRHSSHLFFRNNPLYTHAYILLCMSKKKNTSKRRRRELPAIKNEFFDSFNEMRQQHDTTWNEVFQRFHNYKEFVDFFLGLPPKPTETDMLNVVTISYLLPVWLDHIYQNFIKENIKVHSLKELGNSVAKDIPAVIIAAGASLHDGDNNLERLRDSAFYKEKKGIIISTAHTLRDCINAGVTPDYIVLIDEGIQSLEYIDVDDGHMNNIKGIFSPTINPEVLKQWKGEKYFYIGIIPEKTTPNVQAVLTSLFPFFLEFDGGQNCGTAAWNIARYMGCNQIVLLGLDFAFKTDVPANETPYYGAFRKSYKSDEEMLKKAYRFHTHSFFKTNCYTNSVFDNFRKNAVFLFKKANEKFGTKTINCSPGIIDDKKVTNMWFKDWLAEWEKGNAVKKR